MDEPLLVGVDAGGTATRAVVATLAGRVLGRGRAGAGNPVARVPAQAAASVGAAIQQALGGVEPTRVRAGVIGMAGQARLTEPAVAKVYADLRSDIGLGCRIQVVGDAVVAFAAGTAAPTGAVLIAGTGAIAAALEEWHIVRTADGLGWLLGDEGSGFWLGVATLRAAARHAYAGTRAGHLTRAVMSHLTVDDADSLVKRVYQLQRQQIADMAPLVTEAAQLGDPTAAAIVSEAADRLVATLMSLAHRNGPVVLAGGVLTAAAPIREAVQQRLARRIGHPGIIAGDGAAAAAWLAARNTANLDTTAATRLHARLIRSHQPRSGSVGDRG